MGPQILRLAATGVLLIGIVQRLRRGASGDAVLGWAVLLHVAILAWRATILRFFPLVSLPDVLVFLGLVVLVIYRALGGQRWDRRAGAAVYAAVALMVLFSAVMPAPQAVPPDLRSRMLPIHVGGAIVAYGCFTLHLVLMLYVTFRGARFSKLTALGQAEGPGHESGAADVVRTERVAVRLAVAGEIIFGLFILGMGMLWAKAAWGRYWGWDFKETMSLVTFCVYALYLYFDLVIRTPSRPLRCALTAAGYACLLITFFLGARLSLLHGYT